MNFGLNKQDEEMQRLLRMAQENPDLLKKEYERLLSQNKPVTSKEYLDPNYKLQLDKEGGVYIEPEQHYVIKTTDSKTKEKFFINVVTHPIIDEPEEKEFLEHDGQTGLRIPMSVGPLKEDFDKSGRTCKVVDCIINPNTSQSIRTNNPMLLFFYELINNYLNQKYQIILNEKMKIPKLKYKGKSVEFQRVKGKKNPKIQTLDSKNQKTEQQLKEEAKAFNDVASAPVATTQLPEWELYLIKNDNSSEIFDGLNEDLLNVKGLKFELYLPLLVTGKNVELKIAEDEIEMRAGKIYRIILKPIILVDPETAIATFITQDRKMVIEIDKFKKQIVEEPPSEETQEETSNLKTPIETPVLDNDLLYDIV